MEGGFLYSGVVLMMNIAELCKKCCFRLGQWEPAETGSQELFTGAFTLFELLALEEKTQIAGITIVLDVSGFGFKHLKQVEKER